MGVSKSPEEGTKGGQQRRRRTFIGRPSADTMKGMGFGVPGCEVYPIRIPQFQAGQHTFMGRSSADTMSTRRPPLSPPRPPPRGCSCARGCGAEPFPS